MDLTSGAPFWVVRDGLPAVYPRLKQDRRCEVAIIGGGIIIAADLLLDLFLQRGNPDLEIFRFDR